MALGRIKKNNGVSTLRGVYPINTGIIEDTQTQKEYDFEQPLFDELGLDVDVKVKFSIVNDSSGKEIAVGLDPVERGKVLSINAEGGTLKDRFSGTIIEFAHSRTTEAKIIPGSIVRFETVDFNGKPIATGVSLIK